MEKKIICLENTHILFTGPDINRGYLSNSLCTITPASVTYALSKEDAYEKVRDIWNLINVGFIKSKNDRDQYVPHNTKLIEVKNMLESWINLHNTINKFETRGYTHSWVNTQFTPMTPLPSDSDLIYKWICDCHQYIIDENAKK